MKRRNKKLNPQPEGVDRISHLPDDVLVHILSLLETKDAVRTTALSREWRRRCMWVHVYNLSFDFSSGINDSQIPSVNRTLKLLQAPKITRFSLHVLDGDSNDHVLNPWLLFAMMRHVEVLNVDLHRGPAYGLPEFLFTHDSLRELTMKGCYLMPHRRVDWGSVRVLDLSLVYLGRIENLLSGCPSLEYLRLCDVFVCGGHDMDINQEKLKTLVIKNPGMYEWGFGVHDNVQDREVRVAAPQLEELEISGCWDLITCKLVDVPSLVHVSLDFFFITRDENDGRCRNANAEKELREKVRQIMS